MWTKPPISLTALLEGACSDGVPVIDNVSDQFGIAEIVRIDLCTRSHYVVRRICLQQRYHDWVVQTNY